MCNEGRMYSVTDNSTFVLMARRRKADNTYIVQSDVDEITLSIFDVTDSDEGELIDGSPTTLSKTSVIKDTLQTDSRWTDTKDSTGYNVIVSTIVPSAGRYYRIELLIDLTGAEQHKIGWLVKS